MKQPLVSIIVPVYNAEEYLERCIRSILRQAFTDFELLLIDDGSKDKSGEICEAYAAKDSRIKVFHQENGGVSSARNVGLDHATGVWITFVDSDDELCSNGLSLDYASFVDVGLILTSFYVRNGDADELCAIEIKGPNDDYKDFLAKNLNKRVFSVVWGKFFKKDTIGNLRFDTQMVLGEDTLFTLNFLSRINDCRVVDNTTYIYFAPENLPAKYKLDVAVSINSLSKIHTAYLRLRIKSLAFEKRIFTDYKSTCQERIDAHPYSWYGDGRIQYIYNRVKSSLTFKYRLYYFLKSIPFFSRLRRRIKA